MSVESTIYVTISSEQDASIVQVIKLLLKNGWSIFDTQKRVSYLPLHDDDLFDWNVSTLSEREVLHLLEQKEDIGEIIGLSLYWSDGMTGIILLAYNLENMQFITEINRKTVTTYDNQKRTDQEWYLKRIIEPLKSSGLLIKSYKFEEY